MKRRLFVTLPGLFIVLLLGGYLYLRWAYPEDRLLELLEPRLESALGRAVDIRGAELTALPLGVRLDGVRVAGNPGFAENTLLEVERLRLDLQLLPILRRQIVVRSLQLDEPRLALEQADDGSWNFASPRSAATPGAARTETQPVALTVNSLRIRDGQLHLRSAQQDLELAGPLSAQLRLAADRELRNIVVDGWLESPALTGGDQGRLRMLRDVRLRLEPRARVNLPDSSIQIERLEVALQSLQLQLHGNARIEQGRPSLQLRTTSNAIDLAELLSLLPSNEKLAAFEASGKAHLDLQIDVPVEGTPVVLGSMKLADGSIHAAELPEPLQAIQADFEWAANVLHVNELSARIGESPLKLQGQLIAPFQPGETSFRVQIASALDLAAWTRFATLPEGVELSGQLGASLELQGRLAEKEKTRITGPVTLEDVQIRTPEFRQPIAIQAQLEGRGDSFEILSANLSAGDARLALEGNMRGLLPPERPTLALRGRTGQLDLDELLVDATEGAPPADGEPREFERSLLPPAFPARLEAELQVDELILQQARWRGVDLKINSDPAGFRLTLDAHELKQDDMTLSDLEGTLQGDSTRASGRMTALKGSLGRIHATHLDTGIEISGTQVELSNLQGRCYTGQLLGSAHLNLSLPDSPRYDLKIRAESVEAGDLLQEVLPVGRLITGKINGTSEWRAAGPTPQALRTNLTGNGSGAALNGRLRDLPLLDALSRVLQLDQLKNLDYKEMTFGFEVVEGRVHFPKLAVSSPDLDLNLSGDVGLDGMLDLDLNVTLSEELSRRHVRGQMVSALGSLFADPQGRLVLDFNLGGSLKSPKLQPDLNTTASRRGLKPIDQLDLRRFLEGVVRPRPLEDTVQDLGTRLRGSIGGLLPGKTAEPDSTRRP